MKLNFKKLLSILFVFLGNFLLATNVLAVDAGLNEVSETIALGDTDPRVLAARIIQIFLGFLGVIAVGLIIYGGFLWSNSQGDSEKIDLAKKLLQSAAIGLLIILMAFSIATFVLNRIIDAIGSGVGSSCTTGEQKECGCGGIRTCTDSRWGTCFGSDCGTPGSESNFCDFDDGLAGCQADGSICASGYYCDEDNCNCYKQGELGDPCDADIDTPTCDADSNMCGDYLQCDQESCTCFGPPIITSISPIGGFCQANVNRACQQDYDCTEFGEPFTCSSEDPNGAPGNMLTIHGKNFGSIDLINSLKEIDFEGSAWLCLSWT